MTILEVGAGPVQPLAREVGEIFLKNDKVRCALIRINPIKERRSQYKWEKEQVQKLLKENTTEDDRVLEFEVPDYVGMDSKYITKDEQREYDALKN